MHIDYIHFYVPSAVEWRDWFVRVMGFHSIAGGRNDHTATEIVGNGFDRSRPESVIFVLSSPLDSSSPVARFLDTYPPGVVDVAFSVTDLEKFVWEHSLEGQIKEFNFPDGRMKTLSVRSIADFQHTFIERHGETPILPDIFIESSSIKPIASTDFIGIDHIVLNVFQGDLEKTANWYEKYLGFQKKQRFTIKTARSGLYSQVMVHPESGVQLPINEPSDRTSQIQEFLDINKTAGIQHIALKTKTIPRTTEKLRSAGLSFLTVPKNYYQKLENNDLYLQFSPEEWREIQAREILIDVENGGDRADHFRESTLLQIFTKPIFDRPTFFFELIERRQNARGFGEGNFQALFEAIEREQIARGAIE
ncbi:4-hydroxyphenylpyruvate dioxygenase [Pannus brasiliensis CCIBt3594]|uniref:4-hydroxyphenylpyruvate dioxygenase n=1 Tax=Pannus brasiliensis CCIBt3594 TaxID=1427578 RepID=A0AAW9QG21_9CHRO